jgi:hypothetical protein
MQITYKAHGLVLGNNWGGGRSSYDSVSLESDTRDKLIAEALTKLKDGSLDSGMGFESLRGAILNVMTIRTITYNGLEFVNKTHDIQFVGKLNKTERNFLLSSYL